MQFIIQKELVLPTHFQGLFRLWGHKSKQKQTQSLPSGSLGSNDRDIQIICHTNRKFWL